MKWYAFTCTLPCRRVAPFFLLALSACSTTSPAPPGLVESELGQPLARTLPVRDAHDRQRAQPGGAPGQKHTLSNTARGHTPARRTGAAHGALGDQLIQLNFVEADIQSVVRAYVFWCQTRYWPISMHADFTARRTLMGRPETALIDKRLNGPTHTS